MPLVITKPLNVLPFLRIKQSKKTRQRSAVWHAGPWQFDTATGRHKVKLTRTVRWESRTRAQRAAAKKARKLRRAATSAAWDRYFATRDSASPAPPPGRVQRRSQAPGPTHQSSQAPGRCVACGSMLIDGRCRFCSDGAVQSAKWRQAGACDMCGAAGQGPVCQSCDDTLAHNRAALAAANAARPAGGHCVTCGGHLDHGVCPKCSAIQADEDARARARAARRDQPRPHGHVEAMQAARQCGAVTRDGGRCQRTGDCPYHSKTARRGARNTGTGRETR
jgi:hypothetical protein